MYKLFHAQVPTPIAANKSSGRGNTNNARDYLLSVGIEQQPIFH